MKKANKNTKKTEFQEEFRRLRVLAHMTQAEAGRLLHLKPADVCNREKGRVSITIHEMNSLRAAVRPEARIAEAYKQARMREWRAIRKALILTHADVSRLLHLGNQDPHRAARKARRHGHDLGTIDPCKAQARPSMLRELGKVHIKPKELQTLRALMEGLKNP